MQRSYFIIVLFVSDLYFPGFKELFFVHPAFEFSNASNRFTASFFHSETSFFVNHLFFATETKLRPIIPPDCPPAMRALIEQCWSLQPDKRPDFWQIVKVLEQFESSIARDGTLSLVQNPRCCQDQKKGLLHWIQKLGPVQNSGPKPKPKFT
ncbi:serine/threonine-protein kinase HT1-like [Trifolium medium]|uniref:Serine/threonine-protein kinase HT1-like n=1 Tax=Trifolium medium TaxID=97028 RepID=A0A392MGV1_9FABA|nr:serine/threonine-protein kinase HT1-like [Trifolium medium]